MTWTPLSQRTGAVEPDGPFEGVPDHLRGLLKRWAERVAKKVLPSELEAISLRLRVPLTSVGDRINAFQVVLNAFELDEERGLDLIDALLYHRASATAATLEPRGSTALEDASELRTLLANGGSLWTVSPSNDQLVLVVGEHAGKIYQYAIAVQDEATAELHEAWKNAYGRNGDASDAWDHAIKAVEDVLIPIVVPNKTNATLGNVLGQLGSPQSASLWKMMLPGSNQSHDVAAFVGMLRWLWPNHDRHGGSGPRRTPSMEEARMIVTCAAMIVQWHRQGWIVTRR
ncbi:hypothetical protein [Nocardia alni]|uniref:hypothetical protein n=1 Tax=Nocardia alni TaxID=2815723 RepID=UPI001C23F94D|nr:hypothetical protein [Nocardia alni]